jgi:DNA-binding transcriptional MerR regulator
MAWVKGLSRSQAAEALGISIRRLRDLERDGRLVPTGKKGQRRRFDEMAVERLARNRGARPRIAIAEPGKRPTYLVDNETAAKIFDRLVAQMSKIEIVRELRVHPEALEQVSESFARMQREAGQLPIPRCAKCGENPARFCGKCG